MLETHTLLPVHAAPLRPRRLALLMLACAGTVAALPWPAWAANPDAQALLAQSDAIRNPNQPFRVTVTLTEFEKGVQVNTTTLVSYARTLESGGQFVSLMRFVQPARDAGKAMLKNGSDLWFYDPGTKSSVRIAPQQQRAVESTVLCRIRSAPENRLLPQVSTATRRRPAHGDRDHRWSRPPGGDAGAPVGLCAAQCTDHLVPTRPPATFHR